MAKRDLPDDTVGANQLAVKAKLEPERGRAVYKLDGHQGLTLHRVPLCRTTRDIIARRLADGSRYVFAGRADNASGFVAPDAITRFLWKLKIGHPSATVHDIRRTVGTRMAEMRVPRDVRAAVLNHVNGTRSSVTDAVYNQYEGEDEKRRALRLWQARLRNILSGNKLHSLRWHA
jgi:integrase